MKNQYVILCCLMIFVFATRLKAQNAGINFSGAAPNISAAFDVDVSALAGQKKGLLIPRVTLAELMAMNPLPAPAQGMLVYQTNALQGFYYNVSSTVVPLWTLLINKEALRWDLLVKPIADLSMAHGEFSSSFSFNGVTTSNAFSILSTTLTSGSLLNLFSNSTAGINSDTSAVLNIRRAGANVNANHRTRGINSYVSNTGTGSTNYGGFFLAIGGGENYGIFGKAAGLSTVNYGARFEATGSLTNYGVYASSSKGYGVYGSSQIGDGVYGEASLGGSGIHGHKDGDFGGLAGYGVHGEATGAGALNIGGYFTASGATQNLAIMVPEGGKVSLGTGSKISLNAILGIKNGHINSQQTTKPTITAEASLGSVSVVSVADSSSDMAGAFTLKSGTTSLAMGRQATITYNKPYETAPRVVVSAVTRNAALVNVFITSFTGYFTISFTAAASAGVEHTFNYIVIEN
ncbi:MAG: hypothetical protein V4717_06205 [Bacteroidota bacterium]